MLGTALHVTFPSIQLSLYYFPQQWEGYIGHFVHQFLYTRNTSLYGTFPAIQVLMQKAQIELLSWWGSESLEGGGGGLQFLLVYPLNIVSNAYMLVS